jgi:hypothetical protein
MAAGEPGLVFLWGLRENEYQNLILSGPIMLSQQPFL